MPRGLVAVLPIDEGAFQPGSGLITFSEFSLGTANPIYPPAAYGGGPGSPTVTFEGFFQGQMLATPANCPAGAAPTGCVQGTPSSPLTLAAGAPNTTIVNDGANPTSPVLSGTPTFNGPIAVLFNLDVAGVGLEGGFFDNVGGTAVTAFDSAGNQLGSFSNTALGFQFLGLVTSDGSNAIRGLLFSLVGPEAAGFAIDNLRFGTSEQVEPPPSARFAAACPFGFCSFAVDEPITFVDDSVGAELWDYDWNGDGAFEDVGNSSPVTTHAYATAGVFRPRLRVRNDAQADTFTHVELITINEMSCTAGSSLSCGTQTPGNTGGAGSTAELDSYPCLISPYPGREVAYSFVAPESGQYTVSLSGPLAVDLDLLVVSAAHGSCDPSGCVGSSDKSGLAAESVTFSASEGDEFLVVVDSRGASTSPFQIAMTCPQPPDAAFQVVPSAPSVNQNVSFFDTSTGPPTAWSWNFGDGGQSTSRNPVRSFALPGSYQVQLQAANDSGSDTFSRTVVVAPSSATIGVDGPSSGGVGQVLRFTGSSAGCQPLPNGWSWLVSGGRIEGSATAAQVDVVFSSPGTKSVAALNAACGQAQGSREVELIRMGPFGVPAAPTNVAAAAVPPTVELSSTQVDLSWQDNSSSEDGFLVQRLEEGTFQDLAVAPANATSVRVSVADVLFPTVHPTTFRVLAFNAAGESLGAALHGRNGDGEVSVTTEAESCDPERALCLLGKRFRIEAEWVAANFAPGRGVGHPVALTEDTGYFWFFSPQNVEVVVKVLDGRAITGRYWVFFGALTNQEFRLRVRDTQFGNEKEYFNPRNQFASVADTRALPSETEASVLAGRILRSGGPEWTLGRGVVPRDLDVEFSWTPLQPSSTPADVLFVDRAPVLLRSRTWNLGDGTPPVHRVTPFYRHVYSQGGVFDVMLDVVQGLQMGTDTNRLEITPPLEPEIFVEGPSVARRVNRRVTLGAVSLNCTQDVGNWSWQVDGGQVLSASTTGPTLDVRWPTAGMKTVRAGNSGCGAALGQATVAIFTPSASLPSRQAIEPEVCEPSDTVLCLRDGRFKVAVSWQAPNFTPPSGPGRSVRVTGETGYFWFFNEANVELIVKVLDGRAINGNFWVFYGALSDVRYTIEVTDLETGRVKVYENPLQNLASIGDTTAFPGN